MVVFVVLVAALVWKLMIISLIGTGLQVFLWAYIILDFINDLFARFLLGTFCTYCAYLYLFIFKVATLPIILLGAFWHIFLELMALPISGWMIFFGGSGCIFRWGHDCWFTETLDKKDYWEVADLPLLIKKPEDKGYTTLFKQFVLRPIEEVSHELMKQEGIMRRSMITETCPWAQGANIVKVLSGKIRSQYFDF